MYFKQFFEDKLAQYAYLIGCQATGEAVVIDPMRDIDAYIPAAYRENLTIVAAADTHIHADYISGLREFAEREVKVYASDEGDADWKYEWLAGSSYDYKLMKDGDEFTVGNIRIKAWHTPGHTPEHLSFLVTDCAAADKPMGVITGDFVFAGDLGRPDLLESAAGQAGVMEPSARTLYKTVKDFERLPEYLQVWPGHGAGSACGKAIGSIPVSTVGYEKKFNNSLKAAVSEDNFVKYILEGQPEPPLYFARMKYINKLGPPLLNGLPQPSRLTPEQLDRFCSDDNVVLLDTRSREEYAGGHIPGSLLSPLDRQFNTVAGSYISNSEKICLVVEEERLMEAVTGLVRVGLDNIEGYLTPEDLKNYTGRGVEPGRLETAGFEAVDAHKEDPSYSVLDVRNASEYHAAHIPGAINISHTRLPEHSGEIPKNKKLLVHCQTGRRSAVASAFLKREGFDVILIEDDFDTYLTKTGAGEDS